MFLIILHLKHKTLLYEVKFFIFINIKCSNSWLKNFEFWVKLDILKSAVWALKVDINKKISLNIAAFYALDVKLSRTSLIFICFDLLWFMSNPWRFRFMQLSSELAAPILDRFQKKNSDLCFSIRSFKFWVRHMVSFRCRTVHHTYCTSWRLNNLIIND